MTIAVECGIIKTNKQIDKGDKQMKANEISTRRIFSRNIALELRKQGFNIVRTEVNKKHPQYDVYVFESNDEFIKALNKLINVPTC